MLLGDIHKARAVLLKSAAKCPCGARNLHMQPMQSIDGDEMGVICLKCERFALGETLAESIKNWNTLQLAD